MASKCGSGQLHFVLVHGAGHGAWCWYKIRLLLEGAGHKVTCIDLKCSGIDPTDYNTVFTFAEYNEPLTTFMSSLATNEKVVLVGHSAGGRNVTNTAYKFPDKVHLAIYVAAMMLKFPFGLSRTAEDSKEVDNVSIISKIEQVLLGDKHAYEFINGIKGLPFPTGIIVKPELQRKVLYNLSPIEDATLASMLLRPTPVWALLNLESEKQAEFSVPRVYIKTCNDELFNPVLQDGMLLLWKPNKLLTIESDHSPFFSNPDVLFQLLTEAVASITI
ncbi:Methyl esterase [Parasponia andersonii]|uniref:Methyl esterase n=1 Tax=Parasponia andersonii TaxID=3476 RepID=A0A2P5DHR8_PARAD|nr:Methyl esterase [Parasponia andersonii]